MICISKNVNTSQWNTSCKNVNIVNSYLLKLHVGHRTDDISPGDGLPIALLSSRVRRGGGVQHKHTRGLESIMYSKATKNY